MILFGRRKKKAGLEPIEEELEAMSEAMLTADVYEYGPRFARLVMDNLDLLHARSFEQTAAKVNELKRLVRRHLLPIGAPATITDAISLVIEASSREGLSVSEALRRVETLLAISLNYAATSVADISMNLNYAVRSYSRVFTLGYSSLIKKVILTIRNKLSGVDTAYGRPFMPGKRLAVELVEQGVEALPWPDTDIDNVVEKSDYVIVFSPGIGSEGVAAAEPGSVAAVLSAKKREIPVILAVQSWSFTRESFGDVMDRRIAVYSKSMDAEIYLAPFDYIPLSLIDTLVTEAATYTNPSSDTVLKVHSEMVRMLVSETIRVSG